MRFERGTKGVGFVDGSKIERDAVFALPLGPTAKVS